MFRPTLSPAAQSLRKRWLLPVCAALTAIAAMSFSSLPRALYARLSDITITASVLPRPSGPNPVARTTMHLPLAPSATQPPAMLNVDLWYPSSGPAAGKPRPIGEAPGPHTARHARAQALDGAPAAASPALFPLILYAPGWDGRRNDNTFLLANLASHGYVVAAIDDIGHQAMPREHTDASARTSEPPDLGRFDLSSTTAMANALASANLRLKLMTRRVSHILDAFAAPDSTDLPPQLAGRLDLGRTGMLGFSFGGSAAAESALREHRLSAVVNMDGWLFGASARTLIDKPYMVFNSDAPSLYADAESARTGRRNGAHLTIADRAQQRRQASRADTMALLFKGLDHADFTDDLFSPALPDYLHRWRRSAADRLRIKASIDSYIVAFFDHHLRGQPPQRILSKTPPPSPWIEFLPEPPASHRSVSY